MEWKVSKSSRTYLFLRVQHNSQVTLDFPNPHSSSIPGESFQSLGAPRSMVSESFHIVQTLALRDPQTKQRTHPVRTQQDSENRNFPRGNPYCVPKKPKGGTETAQIKINPATQHRQKSRNFFVKQAQLTLKRYLALLRATKQTSHLCGETCWIPPELKAVISHLAWRFLMLPSPNPWCIPDNFSPNCRVLSAPILHPIDHHRKTKKPLTRFQSRATSFAVVCKTYPSHKTVFRNPAAPWCRRSPPTLLCREEPSEFNRHKSLLRLFNVREKRREESQVSSQSRHPGKIFNPSSVENSFIPVICITINAQSTRHCIQIGPSVRFYWWLRRPLGPSSSSKLYSNTTHAALETPRGKWI